MFKKKTKATVELSTPKEKDSGNNPYLNGKTEWLERYGNYISQAHNWRVFALTCLVISILSLTCNVYQAVQFKVMPHVITVDKLGNTHSAGVAHGLKPTDVPREVIQSELANYISNWRIVTADADLQNRMLDKLIAYSNGATRKMLQDWFTENNPYKRAQNNLVSVDLKGLPQQVAQNSWRAEWTESVRDRSGKVLEEIKYEGTFTVGIVPPETEADIIKNPFGIMVADLYFNKLLQQK